MTREIYTETKLNGSPTDTPVSKPLMIGPRVMRDIELQIHKLENVFHPTRRERLELSKLRALLCLLKTGGDL